jgi:hypothetical protein
MSSNIVLCLGVMRGSSASRDSSRRMRSRVASLLVSVQMLSSGTSRDSRNLRMRSTSDIAPLGVLMDGMSYFDYSDYEGKEF